VACSREHLKRPDISFTLTVGCRLYMSRSQKRVAGGHELKVRLRMVHRETRPCQVKARIEAIRNDTLEVMSFQTFGCSVGDQKPYRKVGSWKNSNRRVTNVASGKSMPLMKREQMMINLNKCSVFVLIKLSRGTARCSSCHQGDLVSLGSASACMG
jgi:hypothetical protein